MLLVLHGSGLGWDEAAMMFGGLAALTGVLLMYLRKQDPATEEAAANEQPQAERTTRHSR